MNGWCALPTGRQRSAHRRSIALPTDGNQGARAKPGPAKPGPGDRHDVLHARTNAHTRARARARAHTHTRIHLQAFTSTKGVTGTRFPCSLCTRPRGVLQDAARRRARRAAALCKCGAEGARRRRASAPRGRCPPLNAAVCADDLFCRTGAHPTVLGKGGDALSTCWDVPVRGGRLNAQPSLDQGLITAPVI